MQRVRKVSRKAWQLACALGLAALLALPGEAGERRLTLEETSGRASVRFSPSSTSVRWASDGVHLARGRGDQEVWIDPESGAERELERSEPRRDLNRELEEAFLRLPGFAEEDARRAS